MRTFIGLSVLLLLLLLCSDRVFPDETQTLKNGNDSQYDRELRIWHDASGKHEVIAKFDRFLPKEMVRLRKEDNSSVDVEITVLSVNDRKLLRSIHDEIERELKLRKHASELAKFTKNIDAFVQVVDEYFIGYHELKEDSDLTEALRRSKTSTLYSEAKKQLYGKQINWHYTINDVKAVHPESVVLDSVPVISGEISGNTPEAIGIALKSSWKEIKKGDIVRVSGKISGDCYRESTLTLKYRNFSIKVCVESVDILNEEQKSGLDAAKVWFAEIDKQRIGAATAVKSNVP